MNAILLTIGAIVGATGIAWALHLKRLKDHVGMTRDEFVAQFQSTGVATAIAAAVYDQFQKLGIWKEFMPSPGDTLEKTYKTVDEDVEENLKAILQRLGFEMPNSGTLQEWDGPLETLSDVVRWVDWVRTKQNPSVTAQ
jgi:2-polyprenyl-6-methoxyphenol hydroxylase-like FAD-dependent oxidoreductase